MEYMVNDRDNLFMQKIRKVIVQNYGQIKEIEQSKNAANKKEFENKQMRANIGEEFEQDEAAMTKKDEKRLLDTREEPTKKEDSDDESEVLYEET